MTPEIRRLIDSWRTEAGRELSTAIMHGRGASEHHCHMGLSVMAMRHANQLEAALLAHGEPPPTEALMSGDTIALAYACHKELSEYFPSLPVTHREVRSVLERHISRAVLNYKPAEPPPTEAPNLNNWTCFHCGETFTTVGSARDHFGATEGADPGCLIDRVALEEGGKPERGRGLLMALRKAEDRIAELTRELDSVENDARLWHESEGERRRLQKGRNTSWFMFLDSLEGERLMLAERVRELEARLAEPPPTEDKHTRDSELRYSQYDMDAATKPLHARIEAITLKERREFAWAEEYMAKCRSLELQLEQARDGAAPPSADPLRRYQHYDYGMKAIDGDEWIADGVGEWVKADDVAALLRATPPAPPPADPPPDSQLRYSQSDMDAATKPLHCRIEQLESAMNPQDVQEATAAEALKDHP